MNIDQEIIVIEKLKVIIEQIKGLQKEGKDLKFINKWSYEQRESGIDMPYFSWGTKSKNPDESYLQPQATVKQKDFSAFFKLNGENYSHLGKYSLYIFESGRIEFYSKAKIDGQCVKTSLI